MTFLFMEFKFLLLLLLCFGSSECGSLWLNVPDEWLFTLYRNRNMEITCAGDKPVQLSRQEEENFFKYTSGFNGTDYYSTLEITYPRKEHTGNYSCSYIGEEEGPTISTYVYVHDWTGDFVNFKDTIILWLDIGQKILLDCRTTKPDMKVTVIRNKKDVTEEFSLDYLRRFSKPAFSLQESGNYSCKEERYGQKKTFVVNIQDPKKSQKPCISGKNTINLAKNKFILNCTFPVVKNLTFKWIVPNNYAVKKIYLFNNKFNETSTLEIKNLTKYDSGDYTCIVERGDSSSWDTRNIKEEIPIVIGRGNFNFSLFEGDNFTWVTKFDGNSPYLNYPFYKFDKDLLLEDKRVSTIYEYGSRSGELTLIINNISAEDSGKYSIRIEAPNGSYDEDYAILIVKEFINPQVLPNSSVSIHGKTLLVKSPYPYRSVVSLSCYVDGRPHPKIKWLKDGKNIKGNNGRFSLYNNNETLDIIFSTKEDEGKYECVVENSAGRIQPFVNVMIEVPGLRSVNIISIISAVIIFSIILCSVLSLLYVRLRKKIKARNYLQMARLHLFQSMNAGNLNRECTIGDQIEMLPYDNIYDVERENIRLGKQLGAGSFGRVLLAEVNGLKEEPSPTRVAVKMCKYESDMTHLRALISELKIMIHLGKHLNIVNLIGAHTSNLEKGELWILLEYCKYGNLLMFIQRSKGNYIHQIDPITGDVNFHNASLLSNNPSSPSKNGSSVEFGRESTLNSDENLETYHEGLMNSFRSKGKDTSPSPGNGFNLNSEGYQEMNHGGCIKNSPSVGRQSSTSSKTRSKEQNLPSNSPTHECEGEHLEMASELPLPDSKSEEESSVFNPISESDYSAMFNTDQTLGYAPPPFPPTLGNIPGVSSPLTTVDLICWAWQIAKGMEFLTSRNVLHGDLAARNLLLADDNVVKICDFGLSKEMYQNDQYLKKSRNMMPIKWMSPEAIKQKIFSIQSDVWAYGVTLWELFTLGDTPYPGMPIKREFAIALEKGMRLEKPLYCNEEIYNLLLDCWQLNPDERPSFSRISDFFSDMLNQDRKQHYVNMNSVYKQKNEEWLSQNEDYLNMVLRPDYKNLISPLTEERKIHVPLEGKSMFDADYLDGEQCVATGGYLDVLKPKPDHLLRAHSQKDQITNMKGLC